MRLPENSQMKHASCVAITREAGVLIVGASGSGKSALALSLMALGATLVSDDQVILTADEACDTLHAKAPAPIRGLIEARGLGILHAQTFEECIVTAIVDLDRIEDERLPPLRKERLIGIEIPLYYRVETPQFAAGLLQVLKGGRSA